MAVSTEPAAEAAKATEPRWALEHHFGYDSPNSKSIDKDLDDIEAKCKALKADFEGKMATDLFAAIIESPHLTCDSKLLSRRALAPRGDRPWPESEMGPHALEALLDVLTDVGGLAMRAWVAEGLVGAENPAKSPQPR